MPQHYLWDNLCNTNQTHMQMQGWYTWWHASFLPINLRSAALLAIASQQGTGDPTPASTLHCKTCRNESLSAWSMALKSEHHVAVYTRLNMSFSACACALIVMFNIEENVFFIGDFYTFIIVFMQQVFKCQICKWHIYDHTAVNIPPIHLTICLCVTILQWWHKMNGTNKWPNTPP